MPKFKNLPFDLDVKLCEVYTEHLVETSDYKGNPESRESFFLNVYQKKLATCAVYRYLVGRGKFVSPVDFIELPSLEGLPELTVEGGVTIFVRPKLVGSERIITREDAVLIEKFESPKTFFAWVEFKDGLPKRFDLISTELMQKTKRGE